MKLPFQKSTNIQINYFFSSKSTILIINLKKGGSMFTLNFKKDAPIYFYYHHDRLWLHEEVYSVL